MALSKFTFIKSLKAQARLRALSAFTLKIGTASLLASLCAVGAQAAPETYTVNAECLDCTIASVCLGPKNITEYQYCEVMPEFQKQSSLKFVRDEDEVFAIMLRVRDDESGKNALMIGFADFLSADGQNFDLLVDERGLRQRRQGQ